MSSSEFIIRRAPSGYTTDGVSEASIPFLAPPATGLDGEAAGTVIRGRRFGLGSGGVMAREGFGSSGSDGRRGMAMAAGSGGGDSAGSARPAYGMANSALLQVDLRDLRQRIEDRGYAAGRARAETELAAAIEAAGAMAARIEAMAPRESTAVAHALVALSTAIAGRVVGAELHLDPTLLSRALESAVVAINGSPEARVMLHPDQLATVRLAWETTHGTAFLGKSWTFEADPSLPPGGCVLRYEHGFVVAGLEAQVELLATALEEAIPGLRQARAADPDEADA